MDPGEPRQRPAERSGQVRMACITLYNSVKLCNPGGQCNKASQLINYESRE